MSSVVQRRPAWEALEPRLLLSAIRPGLWGEYYIPGGAVNDFPNYGALTPVHAAIDATVNLASTTGAFNGYGDLINDFAVRWSGRIDITAAGNTIFYLSSDDGSRLYVDGALVVNNSGQHGMQEANGTVNLSAGYHDIRIELFERGGGAGCIFSFDPAGAAAKQVVPAGVLFHDNFLPTVSNGAGATAEDVAYGGSVSGSDREGDALTYAVLAGPAHGVLTFNANGTFTYTPIGNWNGADSFTFKANDGYDDSAAGTFNLTVNAVNDAPTANNLAASTAEDTPLASAVSGSDVDGNPLTYSVLTGPLHGFVIMNANGTFTYTPDGDWHGADSFTFRARDGLVYSAAATVNLTVTAVNDAPVADSLAIEAAEDSQPVVGVTAEDVDGDAVTFELLAGPSHGGLDFNADGTFVYTPDANWHGADSFTFRAYDGQAYSAPTAVSFTITAVNDAPVADDLSDTTDEDTPLAANVTGSDIDLDSLTFELVAGPAHGALTFNANGTFLYTPNANWNGSDSFTFRAYDGQAYSAPATVSLTVTAVNDAPTANDLAATTDEDTPLAGSVTGSDVDLDALTFELIVGPTHGALTFNADGTFTYTPNANWSGSDSFTFRAFDGQAYSAAATVSLTVTAVNAPPVADDLADTTDEDTPLANNVTGSDTDLDGLTFELVDGPDHGALTFNADGTFTYTPNANWHGSDSFIFRAYDGQAYSAPASVSLTVNAVNDTPAANNLAVSTNEDTPLDDQVTGSDADGDGLTNELITGPTYGVLTFNADGTFTYTPDLNSHGADSFTFRAYDGQAYSAPATVSITVNVSNDAPTADDLVAQTDENTPLAGNVTGNDADLDVLVFELVGGPANGTLTFNADGTFTYTPNASWNGDDSFTFRVYDGQAYSAAATVSITVTSVNDSPIADNVSDTTDEDTPLAGTVTGSDADGDGLAFALLGGPAHGALIFNADGTFTYTPNANWNGADSFTFRAYDGQAYSALATVNITVAPVNDAPIADNLSDTINEDTPLNDQVTGSDVDGDGLTYELNTGPTHGVLTFNAVGTFTYTPNANWNGDDSFTFRAYDGQAYSAAATVTITVDAVNNAPTADDLAVSTNEDTSLASNVTGSDVDGDSLTYSVLAGPAHGALTFNANGTFTYTPSASWYGEDSFTFVARDGSLESAASTVTITVSAVNDAPIADNLADETNEDTPLNDQVTGSDVDGDGLTYELITGPTHGALTFNADGTFTYTPGLNSHGADSFTFRAYDGQAYSAPATVSITVTSVNDASIADNLADATNEDTPLNDQVTGSDVDGDGLTYELITGPAHGALTFNADGTFTYTPNANWNGSDSFTFRAYDGQAYSAAATASLTVTSVNDVPVADDLADSTDEDTPLAGNVTGSDIDLDALTFELVTGPAHGALTFNADGTFLYTPNANWHGADSFTFRAYDGQAYSAAATVSLTVTAINDAPIAGDLSDTTDEDTPLAGTATGSDIDLDALTFELVAGPAHGTLTFNADGTFLYTPNANWHGADSFTFRTYDGQAYSAPATVSLTAASVNDSPVADDLADTTDEDTLLAGSVTGSDIDLDALTFELVTGPAHGALTFNADGTFLYTPNANWHGADGFTFRAYDGQAYSGAATVSLTVTAINDAPIADDLSDTTDEDIPLAGNVTGSDVDLDALTFELVAGPAHGVLTFNADGTFTYTANANWHGSDNFTFRAYDGQSYSAAAAVSLTVTAVNDAPVADDLADSTDEDTPLSGSVSGSDIDGDALTFTVIAGPAHGILVLNADGSFVYTPDANWFGVDSCTFVANDGSADSNVATMTLAVDSVNDVPVADDDTLETDEDTAFSGSVSAGDADGDALTYALVSGPTHGALAFNADGTFTYTPDANWHGDDSFTFVANDGQADSPPATVTLTVQSVNDTPLADDLAAGADEDTSVSDQVNGSDVDGDALTYELVVGPAHGVLAFNADGRFTYTPNANWHGADSFTFRTYDGLAYSAAATVSLTVTSVNDSPVADDLADTTDEDTPLAGTVTGSDIEPDALTFELVADPAHGTLTFNADGTFTYTPNGNWHGSDSFTFRAYDGQAYSAPGTVSLTATSVNDAPTANDLSDMTDEDTPLAGDVTGSDIDPDALTFELITGPAHGTLTFNADGTFTYTPNANWHGGDSFTFRAYDGQTYSAAATASLIVTSVNDAPAADDLSDLTGEDIPLAGSVTGGDIDLDALTFELVAGPAHGTLTFNADGTFTYTPNDNWHGSDSFTFRSFDGQAYSAATAADLTVASINDAPVADDLAAGTGEDAPLSSSVTGSDVDGDALTYTVVSGPTHGALTFNPDGTFTYIPDVNWHGVDSFTFVAVDGELDSALGTVTVAVGGANDAPVADDSAAATDEDTPLAGQVTGSDLDGNALTFVLVSGPAHGSLTFNADGSYTYMPAANWYGTDSFSFAANDGLQDSAPAIVTLTVSSINDRPVAEDSAVAADEDSPITGWITGSDIDGNALSYALVVGPAHGTLTFNADGTFVYRPVANWHGVDSFSYVVNDGQEDSSAATAMLTVRSVNDGPRMGSLTVAGRAGGALAGQLAASDVDGDVLRFSLASGAAHGAVHVRPDGSFAYVPEAGWSGTDRFLVIVDDGQGGKAIQAVSVVVLPSAAASPEAATLPEASSLPTAEPQWATAGQTYLADANSGPPGSEAGSWVRQVLTALMGRREQADAGQEIWSSLWQAAPIQAIRSALRQAIGALNVRPNDRPAAKGSPSPADDVPQAAGELEGIPGPAEQNASLQINAHDNTGRIALQGIGVDVLALAAGAYAASRAGRSSRVGRLLR